MMDKLNSKQQLEYVRSQVHQAVDMINTGLPQAGTMALVLLEQELGVALKDSTPAEGQSTLIDPFYGKLEEVKDGDAVRLTKMAKVVNVPDKYIGQCGVVTEIGHYHKPAEHSELYHVKMRDGKELVLYRPMFIKVENDV